MIGTSLLSPPLSLSRMICLCLFLSALAFASGEVWADIITVHTDTHTHNSSRERWRLRWVGIIECMIIVFVFVFVLLMRCSCSIVVGGGVEQFCVFDGAVFCLGYGDILA